MTKPKFFSYKFSWEREFERNGEERIRLELHNGNLTGDVAVRASQWLGALARKAEARRLAIALATLILTALGVAIAIFRN